MKHSIIPAEAAGPTSERLPTLTRLARTLLHHQLRKVRFGRLRLIDGAIDETFGAVSEVAPFDVTVRVRNPRFYSDVVFAGTVGAGEAYINGYWHCDDLTGLVRLMVVNRHLITDVDSGWSRASDMNLFHLEDIGPHYARTLHLWRERFMARHGEVRAQGYPESFVRMWEYYLCNCEGGFEERQLGDVQKLLTKPRSRRASIAVVNAAPA